MSRADDETYYRRRARQEREIAITCEDNAVALAHLKLADAYEERASRRTGAQGGTALVLSLLS